MFVCVESNLAITAYCEDGGISENEQWKFTASKISEPLEEEHGVPLYKLVDGVVISRTDEEIEADIKALPGTTPDATVMERIKELEEENTRLNDMLDALLEGRQE